MNLKSLKEYFFYTYELKENRCRSGDGHWYEFLSLIKYKKKDGRIRLSTRKDAWNLMVCGKSPPPSLAVGLLKKRPSSIGDMWVDWSDSELITSNKILELLRKYNYCPQQWLFSDHPVKRELAKKFYEPEEVL